MAEENRTIEVPAGSLPVMAEADVVVVGGGTSGFIAATAAARTGAKTILVERFGYLGGCTTAPYNTSISAFFNKSGEQIIGGLPWEYLERMERDGQGVARGKNNRNQLWPMWTSKVALDMITEAGVELYFYTWVSDVLMQDGSISGLIVQNKGGRGVILGKAFVDASGDADLAAFAGSPFEMTDVDNLQQVSCDYVACGVDAGRVIEWAKANKDRLEKINGLDHKHQAYGSQPMFTFVIPNDETYQEGRMSHHIGVMPTVKLCIYREAVRIQGNVEIDPLDPKALTYAEVQGLQGALGHLKYLQETVPGFEGAFIASKAHLGVRETRRIVGDHMLVIDELLNDARFDDVVALNCRSLDYHLKGTVFKLTPLKGHHDVPLGALLPQQVGNLLVVGRAVSCDHESQASLRGAGTCMAIGHAGGTAAALAAQANGDVRALNIRDIQKALIEQGAILGVGDRAAMFG